MSDQEQLELEFLRYFYKRAREAMGPADDDIYDMIKMDYVHAEGGILPEDYK